MLMRVALFVILCAGLAGFGTVIWIETRPTATQVAEAAPPPPPVVVSVLAAAHAVHAGALLKPDDLAGADLPAPEAAAFLRNTPENRAALFGAMVRHTLGQGDPVPDGAVVRQGDHGFLSAVLDPGMRAVTIGLDQVGSDASLIWPGDHIDLILVRDTSVSGRSSARSVSSETVLTDIRVIAVDQQLMQGGAPDDHAQASSKTMTLEVSTEDARRLAIALKLGKLSVSVRSATALLPPSPATSAPAPQSSAAQSSAAQSSAVQSPATSAPASQSSTAQSPTTSAPAVQSQGVQVPAALASMARARAAQVQQALAKPAPPVTWAGDVSQSLAGERDAPESTTLLIYRGAQTAVSRF